MSVLNVGEQSSSSGVGKFVVLTVVLLLAGGAAAFFFLGHGAGEPVETAVEEPEDRAPVVEAGEPEPVAPASRPDLPSTGSVVIAANVDGARVYLDDELAGPAPYENDAIDIGRYDVKVVKDGYAEHVENIRIRPGKRVQITASLRRLPPSLTITSDIEGATVFLDRNYVGTTPVAVKAVEPGEHQLTVSADGYDMYAETITMADGDKNVRVAFQRAAAELNESIPVLHKHSFGKCQGRLVADTNGIRYETDHKDAFTTGFGSLERFEVDYIDKNMNLKVRGGRNYNFTELSGNADALFVFHKNVQEFLDRT